MKAVAYITNLVITAIFLSSIFIVYDDASPLYIFTLVMSTIGLTIMFIQHTYGDE